MAEGRIPLWLKLVYTGFMLVWVPVYTLTTGPANFLWLCDVANFVVLAAIWLESPLLFSSQAVGVLLIQLVWSVDYFGRLILGGHPIGGTEYMFDATQPLAIRSLSLFHIVTPLVVLWATWRLGFDRRGWRLQTVFCWLILPLSLLADPERNLNWLWKPFGVEQVWMPTGVYLLLCMVLYPLILFLPTHFGLQALVRRFGGRLVG